MLDEYKNIQPLVYKILKNAVSQEKYTHAYLFETNSFYDSYNFILAFVKSILCPNHYTESSNCKNCYQCQTIKDNNFPELEIIKPDGMWIKKEQLIQLQEKLNKKPIIGTKKIYIITEANRLNKQSANSILKFLEEPEENIIAILITNNIYQVIETIRSRCQIIRLANNQQNKNHQNFSQQQTNNTEQIEKIIEFINKYEKIKQNILLYLPKMWHPYIKTKEDYINALNIITLYYKDIINKKLKRKLEYFSQSEEINQLSQSNTLEEICYKIKIIEKYKENIKYNLNTNLLMDKLIIELGGK